MHTPLPQPRLDFLIHEQDHRVGHLQPVTGVCGDESAEPSASGSTTSSLNRASLAKVDQSVGNPAASIAPPPAASYAVTSDASVAQARVRAMAMPIMQSAASSGREAARAAAPEGLGLPMASLKDAPQ
jgi:hypothetical protein